MAGFETQHHAQCYTLADMGDEERAAALLHERGRHFGSTQSIGVGFDHARAYHTAEPRFEPAVVLADGVKIDRQNRPCACFGNRVRAGRNAGRCSCPALAPAAAMALDIGRSFQV